MSMMRSRHAHEAPSLPTASTPSGGMDGARAVTVQGGWTWIFSAGQHWNGDYLGTQVANKGDRSAAPEPAAQGLTRLYGAVTAEFACALSLRMDHSTQYLADDFQDQIRHWGIILSFVFVEQPQTNGVAERFNHTYNTQWSLEKLRSRTQAEVRRQYALPEAA